MTKTLTMGTAVALSLIVASVAMAQGRGRGTGVCDGTGPGNGVCNGFAAGWGQGWQGRVAGVADEGLAAEITSLHDQIRARQWALRAGGGDTAALEAEIAALRARLHTANDSAGLCTGTGPHAYGMQAAGGRGNGQGMGYGRRGGGGRGQGMGNGRGQGRGGVCPWR